MERPQASREVLRCSFCNKAQDEVGKLIAGPEVYICDECVRVCLDIIENEHTGTEMSEHETSPSGALPVTCTLCRTVALPHSVLLVENKGTLCPVCLEEVQAALAAREKQDPQSGP